MSEPLDFAEMDRLLEAALETPAADRARWVAMVPGLDEDGRRELARLIRLAEGADDVLPAAGAFHGLVWEELARELGGAQPPLRAGDRVGIYEVRGLVGVGGMGCVYRAFDPVLGREVAIKALLRGTIDAAGARRRLEQEARLLAALNHPNIAAIHGSEQVDGVLYLILELVEGETLAERLRRGALPNDEAVGIARQVTDALEEAHRNGIVHRDLKPSNITILADGRVKVLDFGIARSVRGGDGGPDVGLDTAGVMGTPAYMSPEQRLGAAVGTASDVWAFGCVLYEMLAGHPVFDGDGRRQMSAVARTDDADWSRLPADTPPELVRLLRRCLRREAHERFPDVAAMRAALEKATAARRVAVARASAGGTVRRIIAPGLVAAALLFDMIAFGRGSDSRVAPTPATTSTADAADTDLPPESYLAWADESGAVTRIAGPRRFREARLSPDGRRVAFCIDHPAGSALWTLDLESAVLQRVAFVRSLQFLVWTPDGGGITIANFGRGGWWRLRTFSATSSRDPIILYEGGRPVYPNAWSADGRFLLVQEHRPATDWDLRVLEVGADGRPVGTPRDLVAGPESERNAALAPDGRWVAYESGTPADIHVVPFRGGAGRTTRPAVKAAVSPQWGGAGQLYYWSRTLSSPAGSIQQVLSRLAWSDATSGVGAVAASPEVSLFRSEAVLPARYDLDRSRERLRFLVLETGAPDLDRAPLLRPARSGAAGARMPRRFKVSYADLVELEEDTHARKRDHRTSPEGR